MAEEATRLEELERTVRALYDRLEIYEIVASYAPAFDGGSSDAVADAFMDDGIFDVGVRKLNNREEIRAFARGDNHPIALQKQMALGSGHVLSMPTIRIKDDRAVATCTSQYYNREGTSFTMSRLTAVRFELVRTMDGWKIERRTNRLIDESGEGKALYRAAMQG